MPHSHSKEQPWSVNPTMPHRRSARRIVTSILFSAVLALLVTLLASHRLAAQPGWVKDAVKQAESLSIERDVPALVLTNCADVSIKSSGAATWHRRQAVKILTAQGAPYGTLAESVDEFTKIPKLKGWLISGGKTTELAKSDIAEIAATNAKGYYDDEHVLVARFPQVLTGDIVAFEFDVEENVPFERFQHTFYFQSDLPIANSSLTVCVPAGWALRWSGQLIDSIETRREGDCFSWTFQYQPARMDEPFMAPLAYAIRAIHFVPVNSASESVQTDLGWRNACRQAWMLTDSSSAPDDSVRSEAARLTSGLSDTPSKVKAICDFARENIRYVALEIGQGGWVPRPAGYILKSKFGDCKDKAALTRSLLKCINVPSWPVLISVGRPVDEKLSSAFQFNHCIVALPDSCVDQSTLAPGARIGNLVFFDPTNEAVELGAVSTRLSGLPVLVASPDDSSLKHLPIVPPTTSIQRWRADVRLSADNKLEGRVTTTYFGVSASETRQRFEATKPDERIEGITKWMAEIVSSPVISDFSWHSDADSTWLSYALKGERPMVEAGDTRLLKLDLFHEDSPEAIDAQTRKHPFYFGPPHETQISVRWTLPAGWKVTKLPDPQVKTCDVARLACSVAVQDSVVEYSETESYNGGIIPADQASTMCAWIIALRNAQSLRLSLSTR